MDNSSTPPLFNKEIEYKTFRVDKLINNPFWNSSNSFVKSVAKEIRGKPEYNCILDDYQDFVNTTNLDDFKVIIKSRSVGMSSDTFKHFLKAAKQRKNNST